MKKIYLLVAFCAVGLIVQAEGIYMTGVNQLEQLVQAVQDENGNPLAGLSQLEYENGNVKGDQSHWYQGKPQEVNLETDIPLFGFVWAEKGYTDYYPSGSTNKYRLLTAINWANKQYEQKSGVTIDLNQDAMTVDASASVKEKNDLSALASIDFSGNYLRDILLDGLGALTNVNLSNNPTLTSLSIKNCTKLTNLIVDNATATVSITNSQVPFSVLNNFSIATPNYTYAPQGIIKKTFPVDNVDLSSEYLIGANTTTFEWIGATPLTSNNGVFTFNNSDACKIVTCILRNATFPQFGEAGLAYEISLTSGASGIGTIATPEDLDNIRLGCFSEYQLTADIDLSNYLSEEGWTPIDNFTGTLDGNGHVISGLYIDKASIDNVGLFSIISGVVEIKNLGIVILSDKSVKGHKNVGALIGCVLKGGSLSISKCFVNGKMEATGEAGALIGKVLGTATIENAYALGDVAAEDHTGGMVGQVNDDDASLAINKSYIENTVKTVVGTGNAASAGGFVGSLDKGATSVSNCVAVCPAITYINYYMAGRGRIVGYGSSYSLANNFSWENTTINGQTNQEQNRDQDPLGAADNKNGLNKTAFQLRSQSTYATDLGWDFNTIWTMGNGEYRLPVLKSFASGNQPSEYVSHLSTAVTWKNDAASTSYMDANNWADAVAPASHDELVINKNAGNFYPAIPASTTIASLKLQAGAEIANQHNLTVTGTTDVEYAVAAGRWNMLSVPFAAKSGDFHFNDTPQAWLKKFTPSNNEAGWTYINSLEENLPAGTGFVYWIETGDDQTFSVSGNSLSNSVSETLVFGNDADLQADFALAGNPFLTSIDFDELVAENPGVIGNSYLIWTGAGFSGYNPDGAWGIEIPEGLTENIAPLQSFIVEKGNGTSQLQFDVADIQATGSGVLKVAAETGNKLNIVASNNIASVSTFIAERENGASSRKLFAAASNVPDIYTLDGTTALGANIIHSNNLTIPLGLNTTFAGEITFTLSGMDTYSANIALIDNLLAPEGIDITGLATYSYPFDNSASGKIENRFSIQLSPKTVTGVNPIDNDRVIDVRYYNLQGVEIPVEALHTTSLQIKKTVYQSGAVSVGKIIGK